MNSQRAPEKIFDFFIIGQGVAGTFLARELIERGKSVLVIDNDQRESSSRVAAGLLNPITGMRLRLAEGTHELLKNSKKLFAKLAGEHGKTLFTPIPICRIYDSEKEIALKATRHESPEYAALMSPNTPAGADIANPLGSFIISGGGWVDLPLLLDLEATWLRERGALVSGNAEAEEFLPESAGTGVYWKNNYARTGVIFCNGYKAGHLPWFKKIPWQPAKGEIVDCQTDIESESRILNRDGWAIPLGGGIWRSGSTWEWKQLDEIPTPALGEELRAKLQKFFRSPANARLVEHRAGVRPCVRGNHPYCGTHPALAWCHLFGGLGPKGTFWGPTCAALLADWLCEKKPLPARFDLRREPDWQH